MKSNAISIVIALVGIIGITALAMDNATLEKLFFQACAASKGDRAEYYRVMREAFDVASKMKLSGDDLFYAGCIAAKLRRFTDAGEYLERYIQQTGEYSAVATATLVEVYSRTDYEKARRAYDRFQTDFAGSNARDLLNRGAPANVKAALGLYTALVLADRAAEAVPLLKTAIEKIGDNSDGAFGDGFLLNYHSWYASHLEQRDGWEAAVAFLRDRTTPLFKGDPAYDAKVRDRIQFTKLRHYVETDQYEKGLKELQETVESYRADETSFRRVSKALKRFSLYGKPAPEIVYQAWIGGEPTNLAGLQGKVIMLEFFTSG